MTYSELSTAIASNLREINTLNGQVRAISAGLAENRLSGWDHRSVLIETATMRIGNLMFWVSHWTEALAKREAGA